MCKKQRPRQPVDMIRVTHARINVGTEIADRGGWLNWNGTDDDRFEGASRQAASRTQPYVNLNVNVRHTY